MYLTVFTAVHKPLFTGVISISSRIKRVEEKAAKHQLKIAVMMKDPVTKKLIQTYCTCNFSRHEDMVAYEEEFGKAVTFIKEN